MQAQQITALLSVSLIGLNMGPSMAISISHQRLVRSWTFAGAHSFLAGLFILPSRQSIVNRFRTSGRNWFRTIIRTMKKKQVRVFCIVFWDVTLSCAQNVVSPACKWMVGKQVMWLETDQTVNYHWPHSMSPTLAWQLSKLTCSNDQFHTLTSERQRLSARETA